MTSASLQQSALDFGRAMDALRGRRHITVQQVVDGERVATVRSYLSLYDEITSELSGRQGTANGSLRRSLPPAWVDGLQWIDRVHRAVADWYLDHRERVIVCLSDPATEHPTIEDMFHALSRMRWAPSDADDVARYAETIQGWVERGEHLLDGPGRVPLRGMSCPECNAARARVQLDDGWGWTPALQANAESLVCLACRTSWDPSLFRHMGRVLECQSPEDFAKANYVTSAPS